MKVLRLVLSFVIFAFGTIAALSFSTANERNPAYIMLVQGEPVCVPINFDCVGTGRPCTLYIPNVGMKRIFEFNNTIGCGLRHEEMN